MVQRAIWSLTDVCAKKRKVAALLLLHGKLHIPVNAIQMDKKTLQLF
jgi:hypothetical protein